MGKRSTPEQKLGVGWGVIFDKEGKIIGGKKGLWEKL